MKETFGEYIKRLRTENELTLTQLAAKLDLDSANLSKIENNKREFDEKRLELLANVFNLDLAQLRTEFFSDIIAKKIYENNCDSETLILAEQKVEYLKSKNLLPKQEEEEEENSEALDEAEKIALQISNLLNQEDQYMMENEEE